MSEAPKYNSQLVRFRDATDSGQFNTHTDELFYDLTELFNIANRQDAELDRLRQFFEVGSYFAQDQMDQMRNTIRSLQEDIAAVQKPGEQYTKTLYVTDMRADETVSEYERAFVDIQHDIVTLPAADQSGSKLYLYDDVNKEYIVPNTLKYTITPAANGFDIKENDLLDALTPDDFKFWHRQYVYPSGLKSQVECQIVISLPDNIISSRDVNTIYIHPFPLKAIDVVNVEYHLDGGWKTVPGFTPQDDAANLKLCFSPTAMKEIRITLRQRHPIRKGNKHIFHIGLRQIGVFYHDYQSGIGRFEIPVEFNSAFNNKTITGINPVYQNETALSVHQTGTRLLTFKVYEVDENGKLSYLNDTFPIQVKKQKILLKGIMSIDRNTRSTPAVSAVELLYKGDS